MAALSCEICGGKLMAKAGGIFECDSCGMLYDKTRIQEMVQEIKGTVKVEGTVEVTGKVQIDGGSVKVEGGVNIESLLKRGWMALEDKKRADARKFFDEALNLDAECAEAYFGKVYARYDVTSIDELLQGRSTEEQIIDLKRDPDIQKALRFSDAQDPAGLNQRLEEIIRLDREKKENHNTELPFILKRIAPVQGMIAAGRGHTVGLKSDGTVVAVGNNNHGQCNVDEWWDIVAVAAGNSHTVGLKADGTVVAVGGNELGQCDVSGWQDIIAVSASYYHTVGLKSDGTVVAVGENTKGQRGVGEWNSITAISAGHEHIAGLKTTGMAVAIGNSFGGRCDVCEWRNIIAIAAGYRETVGLKTDGTVVFGGSNEDNQKKLAKWRYIVSIAAGFLYTVGLKSDGTVVAYGRDDDGQCNVADWRDVVAIAAGHDHTVGLKSDGTLIAVGGNEEGQCNVESWKLFGNIGTLDQELHNADMRHKAGIECRRAEEKRLKAEKYANLLSEREALKRELSDVKSLFFIKRRKEIETRLAEIESELKSL